jgi:hypothetical protein
MGTVSVLTVLAGTVNLSDSLPHKILSILAGFEPVRSQTHCPLRHRTSKINCGRSACHTSLSDSLLNKTLSILAGIDLGRNRTCNLLIRIQTRCPLCHMTSDIICGWSACPTSMSDSLPPVLWNRNRNQNRNRRNRNS